MIVWGNDNTKTVSTINFTSFSSSKHSNKTQKHFAQSQLYKNCVTQFLYVQEYKHSPLQSGEIMLAAVLDSLVWVGCYRCEIKSTLFGPCTQHTNTHPKTGHITFKFLKRFISFSRQKIYTTKEELWYVVWWWCYTQ